MPFVLPTKEEVTRQCQDLATEVENRMWRWKTWALKMDGLSDTEITNMGFTTEQLNYIRSFVVALKNIDLKFRNQAPVNADDPSYFVGYMAKTIVF